MSEIGYTLVVNVGNSNTIFGVFAGDNFMGKWRMETRAERTADEYGFWLLSIFEKMNIHAKHIHGVCIATTLPKAEIALTSMALRFFDTPPIIVGAGSKTGIAINYGRVGDLGPDRLANIIALNNDYKKNAIVVDFGTTTSFDVISNGKYLGGAVAPGLSLSLSALSGISKTLPDVGFVKPNWVVGKNITHSMQSGCYWGAVDMVHGLINRIWEDIDTEEGTVIATGGFANEMAEGVDIFHKVDTNLTLKGLKLLHDMNL